MRILVIKPSSLGDIIHAMVVISALKAQVSDCVIDWVVGDKFAEVIKESQIARNVFIYERHGGLFPFIRLLSEVHREEYDYVFDMQGLARSGAMTWAARSLRKIGRRDARELSILAYSDTVTYPSGPIHAVDILREFLDIIGLSKEVSGIVPELNNIRPSNFESFLLSGTAFERMICLFPESRRSEKEWHFFSDLLLELLENTTDTTVLLLGQRKFGFAGIVSPQFFDLRGATSLVDIIFLIKHADLVIANDSGPLHISAALGRQTVGLFTATSSSRFGPYPISRPSNVALCLKNDRKETGIVRRVALEMLQNQPALSSK
jgi:ADP-heptose:LPS heptosyltransferase